VAVGEPGVRDPAPEVEAPPADQPPACGHRGALSALRVARSELEFLWHHLTTPVLRRYWFSRSPLRIIIIISRGGGSPC
jgi:hypothetical protein